MSQQDFWERMNGVGITFRFITPILIAVIGWLLVTMAQRIILKIDDLDLHFTNHLMHHQDLEVGYEKRLSIIESSRFSNYDGKLLEIKIEELKTRIEKKNSN